MIGPCVDGTVQLDRHAEEVLRLEVERCEGFAIDPDEAVQASAAYNFLSDTVVLLEAAGA